MNTTPSTATSSPEAEKPMSQRMSSYDDLTVKQLWDYVKKDKNWRYDDFFRTEVENYNLYSWTIGLRRSTTEQDIFNRIKEQCLLEAIREKEKESRVASAELEVTPIHTALPSDIVVQISLFLNGGDMSRTMAMVCKDWRELLETENMWQQRFDNEYTFGEDNAKVKLPHLFGWKQKYVMRNTYMNNKCTFCFDTMPHVRVYDISENMPIKYLKVLVCSLCQDKNIIVKTKLRKKFFCNDKELRQLTPYQRYGKSRTMVYFMTEFLSLVDERDDDIDGTIQHRKNRRNNAAQLYLKRLMNSYTSDRDKFAWSLKRELELPIEVAQKIAKETKGCILSNYNESSILIGNLRRKKNKANYFKKMTGRDPTWKEQFEYCKGFRGFNEAKDVDNFLEHCQNRELISTTLNNAIAKKFEGRYKRCEDLPVICRAEIFQFRCDYDVRRAVEIGSNTFATIVNKEIESLESKLEREEKLKELIESAGFNYDVLSRYAEQKSPQIRDYVNGIDIDLTAARMARDMLLLYARMEQRPNLRRPFLSLPDNDQRKFLRHMLKELLVPVNEDKNDAINNNKRADDLEHNRLEARELHFTHSEHDGYYYTNEGRSYENYSSRYNSRPSISYPRIPITNFKLPSVPDSSRDIDGDHMSAIDRNYVTTVLLKDYSARGRMDYYTYPATLFPSLFPDDRYDKTRPDLKDLMRQVCKKSFVLCEPTTDDEPEAKDVGKNKSGGITKGKGKRKRAEEPDEDDESDLTMDIEISTESSSDKKQRKE